MINLVSVIGQNWKIQIVEYPLVQQVPKHEERERN